MSRFYGPLQSPAMRTDPYGGTGWNRTSDTLSFNQVLYLLSYSSIWRRAQNSNLIPSSSTIRLAGGPQTFWVHSPYGWDGWIRTNECRCQRPVPYHLATSQYVAGAERLEHPPAVLETAALPVELYPRMVMPAGLEPAISSLRGWRPKPIRRRHHLEMRAGFGPAY